MSQARRRGEARSAILDAARAEFAAKGYQAAGIKEIARAAGVSATLIYRYFGSKAALFEETIIGPGREFVEEFLHDWEHPPVGAGRAEVLADLIEKLYDFTVAHQELLAAWAAAGRPEPSGIVEDGSHGQGLRSVVRVLIATDDDPDDADPQEAEMAVICAAGLVLSVVIMGDVLFPTASPLRERDLLIAAITRYVQATIDVTLLG